MSENSGKDLTPKQVFAELYRNGSGPNSQFGATHDPISSELRNPDIEKYYLNSHPVIPFNQMGEVNPLFLSKLSKLSPTNASIIKNKVTFTTGGQLEVQRRKMDGWVVDEDLKDVTSQEAAEYREWIKDTFGEGDQMLKAGKKFLRNFCTFGNAFLELHLIKVNGEYKARFYNHDFDRCLYLPTNDGEPKIIQISPTWYHPIKSTDDPAMIPLYPNFAVEEDGSMRTMFHEKEEVPGRAWYGEPEWISAMYFAYMEIQMGEYSVSGYSNEWTPRIFIETFHSFMESIPPMNEEEGLDGKLNEEGPKGFRDTIKSFFTNRGAVRSRWIHKATSTEAKETKIHEFKPTQDHEGHEVNKDICREQLIVAHNWHMDLMVSTPGRLGGSELFKSAFQAKYYTVIKPLEDLLVDVLNKGLRIVAEFQGNSITDDLSVGLQNLYAHMLSDTIETEEEAKKGDTSKQEDPDVKLTKESNDS